MKLLVFLFFVIVLVFKYFLRLTAGCQKRLDEPRFQYKGIYNTEAEQKR